MKLPEIFMKTIGILLFSGGTILVLFANKCFKTDHMQAKYLFIASMVLFFCGSVFIIFPPASDWLAKWKSKKHI